MTRNRKIKEFSDSDIYLELIKELGNDNFNKELQSVEIEFDILKGELQENVYRENKHRKQNNR